MCGDGRKSGAAAALQPSLGDPAWLPKHGLPFPPGLQAALGTVGEHLLADFFRTSVYSSRLDQPEAAGLGVMHVGCPALGCHLHDGVMPGLDTWGEAASVWAAGEEDVSVPLVFGQLLIRPKPKGRGICVGPRQRQPTHSCTSTPAADLGSAAAQDLALQAAAASAGQAPSGGAVGVPVQLQAVHTTSQRSHVQQGVAAASVARLERGEGYCGEADIEQGLYGTLLQGLPPQCLQHAAGGVGAAEKDGHAAIRTDEEPVAHCALSPHGAGCNQLRDTAPCAGELESPLLLRSLLCPM